MELKCNMTYTHMSAFLINLERVNERLKEDLKARQNTLDIDQFLLKSKKQKIK